MRVLSKETVEKVFEEQIRGEDLVLGRAVRFGLGFGISGDENKTSPGLDSSW